MKSAADRSILTSRSIMARFTRFRVNEPRNNTLECFGRPGLAEPVSLALGLVIGRPRCLPARRNRAQRFFFFRNGRFQSARLSRASSARGLRFTFILSSRIIPPVLALRASEIRRAVFARVFIHSGALRGIRSPAPFREIRRLDYSTSRA